MGERVRVVRHGERLVAVKEAGADGRQALEAEAEVLHRVQGPGVVELVGLRGGEPPALLTAWVGPRSLAEIGAALPPRQAAALCLAVAATLGRLHRAGVVHAAVEPAHVLLDAHGRPVLCGFGSAGPIGAPVRRPATGRSGPTLEATEVPPSLRPALDVAGAGALLTHLLGPGPTSGLGRTARRSAGEWRALTAVGAHACLEDPSARPSLAAFTRAVRKAAPDAHLDDDHGATDARPADAEARGRPVPRPSSRPAPRPSDPRRAAPREAARSRRRLAALPAVLGLLAVGATTYFGLSAWWSPSPGTASASARQNEAPTPTTATTALPPTSVSPSAAEPVVIEHEGRRYGVGAEGDVVLVGPWRCDGRSLAAVLRADDGTVHLFDAWAAPDGDLSARPVTVVPGATRLDAAPDGPGCAALVVGDDADILTTLTAEDLR